MHLGERGVSSVFSSLDPPRAPLSTPYSLSITYQMDRQFSRISTKKVKERKKHNQDGLSIGSTAKKVKKVPADIFPIAEKKNYCGFSFVRGGENMIFTRPAKKSDKNISENSSLLSSFLSP